MTTIFKQLSDMLAHDERIQFTLTKENGQLAVLIQPVLKVGDEGLSDAASQLRAALAMPLYVRANAETLDADFAGCVQQYQTTRNGLHGSLNAAIARVKESAKEAQADNQAASTTAKKIPQAVAVEVKSEEPAAVTTITEKSLF